MRIKKIEQNTDEGKIFNNIWMRIKKIEIHTD